MFNEAISDSFGSCRATREKERCCPQRCQVVDKYGRFVYIDSLGMVDATKLIRLMELERTFIDKFPTHERLLNSILIKVPLFQNCEGDHMVVYDKNNAMALEIVPTVELHGLNFFMNELRPCLTSPSGKLKFLIMYI
ncbi:hypothetical protein CTI12_AA301680 [Artemisia annua]|uniref:Uncharacterized protein n=1 Tax=Artemisia annua TaxID=35608 RepID=A0A2U1N1R0_ARTAN|nr:hypothetical protein CTI12_AA301680 [Artemisia annua]